MNPHVLEPPGIYRVLILHNNKEFQNLQIRPADDLFQ